MTYCIVKFNVEFQDASVAGTWELALDETPLNCSNFIEQRQNSEKQSLISNFRTRMRHPFASVHQQMSDWAATQIVASNHLNWRSCARSCRDRFGRICGSDWPVAAQSGNRANAVVAIFGGCQLMRRPIE